MAHSFHLPGKYFPVMEQKSQEKENSQEFGACWNWNKLEEQFWVFHGSNFTWTCYGLLSLACAKQVGQLFTIWVFIRSILIWNVMLHFIASKKPCFGFELITGCRIQSYQFPFFSDLSICWHILLKKKNWTNEFDGTLKKKCLGKLAIYWQKALSTEDILANWLSISSSLSPKVVI